MRPQLRLRYMVVNDRHPKGQGFCFLCPATLDDGYVRDFYTNIHYCSHWCLEAHIEASEGLVSGNIKLIGRHA